MPNEYFGTSISTPKMSKMLLFSHAPMLASPSTLSQERMNPATTTPQRLPIPPRITMHSRKMEILKSNWLGNAPELNVATYAPAIPPKNAPIA